MSVFKDHIFLGVAKTLSALSTCSRRAVGCVLTDDRYRIIGSGYNGVPSGHPHCTEYPCLHRLSPHGSTCEAVHAETNAIAQCKDVSAIHTVFTTSFPCFECFKLIMNTGAKRIVFEREYPATATMVRELNAIRAIELVQYPNDVDGPIFV